MSLIDDLRQRRKLVFTEAKALADRAANENRAFDEDEDRTWQRLNADLDSFDARIGQVSGEERRGRETAAMFDRLGSPTRRYDAPGDAELRSFLRGDGRRHFELQPELLDLAAIQKRALTTGVAAEGGDTVPTSFFGRLVTHMIEVSPVLQLATVVNTTGGEPLQVPKTTAHSSASIVAEGSVIGTSEPVFGQVELGAFKYGTLIQVSRELVDDTGVDLEGYLARQTGRALGNAFGAHATTGDGVDKPRGYTVDATVGATGGTATAPSYDDLVDLHYSVIAPYRQSPETAWTANDATHAELRKIKGSDGQPILTPNFDGSRFNLFGKPVISDPNVADVATGAKSLIFGDFSAVFVRIAGGVRFERSDDAMFSSDMIVYRALLRIDSATVDVTGALKAYVSA